MHKIKKIKGCEKKMPRKLVCTAPHVIKIVEYSDSPLKENEVLIKTEYASGKHGTTTAMFDAVNFVGHEFNQNMHIFIEKDKEDKRDQKKKNNLFTFGTTGTGVVEEVGSNVTKWEPGDRVLGLMKVSETNVCKEDGLWALEDLDPLQALCFEPAYVSFHSIREGHVRYGDSVVVIGLGAIGLISVQMAYRSGAETVIAVDPLEERRKWAKEHGADYVLDPTVCDVGLEVHRLTEKRGADVAIEVSGNYLALKEAVRSVRVGGTVVSAGFYQGESKGIWLGREWHHNRINIVVPHGCGWGHPPRDYPGWDSKRGYNTLVNLLKKGYLNTEGIIKPLVSIEEMPEVFRMIEEEPSRIIKYGVSFK